MMVNLSPLERLIWQYQLPLSESITAWVALEEKWQMGALAPDPEERMTLMDFPLGQGSGQTGRLPSSLLPSFR